MAIRLLNLDPVTYATTPEEEAYIGKFLSPGTVLESRQISRGPHTIESEVDEALALGPVVEACIQAERDGFQGIFIDCFGDPGVRAAREAVEIPVFGGFEPAVYTALGLGDRIGILTVVKGVLPMLRGVIARNRLDSRIVFLQAVEIPVVELTDHQRLCGALVALGRQAVAEHGAEVLVLGCTAMMGVAEAVQGALEAEQLPVPVLEPAQIALAHLEHTVKLGLRHSRLTYQKHGIKEQ